MKEKLMLTAVIATLSMGAYAVGESMQDLDTDQDSQISRSEAEVHSGLSERYDELDTNMDGQLDEDEFARFEEESSMESESETTTPTE